jgi:hypothetical protein
MTDDRRFEQLASRLRHSPGVTEARMFDARVLKVRGKVFAMLVKGAMVVKLPPDRVGRLIAESRGQPFDPGHGRIMKGWVTIPPERRQSWTALASDALEFVAASATGFRRRRSPPPRR